MSLSPEIMHFALLACILGMALLAVFYLRRRELSLLAYAGWGLLALLIPLIGPFLVLWFRPGKQLLN